MVDLSIITQPITVPDFSDLNTNASKLRAIFPAGTQIIVNDITQQENLLGVLRDVRTHIKGVESRFKAIKDPMNAAKNAVLALEHEMVDPMKDFERALSSANSNFILRQQQEADRIAREQAAKDRAEREEKALAEAAAVESTGDTGRAEEILQEAITAPTIAPAPAIVQTARVQGIQSRASYSAKVNDLRALVEHCLAHPELLPVFIGANEVALNAQARAMKESFNFPGCELVKKYV